MKNIVNMLTKIGSPVKFETVKSWKPDIERIDIEKSNELKIENDMVSLKKSSIKIENLTYEQLIDLINKYNENVENEFANYSLDALKVNTIRKYLESRYELIEFEMAADYMTFEGKRKGNLTFLAIVNNYTEEIEKRLYELFKDEDLTIYFISKSFNSDVDEFVFKDANNIIEKNINKPIIKKETVEILKIEKES